MKLFGLLLLLLLPLSSYAATYSITGPVTASTMAPVDTPNTYVATSLVLYGFSSIPVVSSRVDIELFISAGSSVSCHLTGGEDILLALFEYSIDSGATWTAGVGYSVVDSPCGSKSFPSIPASVILPNIAGLTNLSSLLFRAHVEIVTAGPPPPYGGSPSASLIATISSVTAIVSPVSSINWWEE